MDIPIINDTLSQGTGMTTNSTNPAEIRKRKYRKKANGFSFEEMKILWNEYQTRKPIGKVQWKPIVEIISSVRNTLRNHRQCRDKVLNMRKSLGSDEAVDLYLKNHVPILNDLESKKHTDVPEPKRVENHTKAKETAMMLKLPKLELIRCDYVMEKNTILPSVSNYSVENDNVTQVDEETIHQPPMETSTMLSPNESEKEDECSKESANGVCPHSSKSKHKSRRHKKKRHHRHNSARYSCEVCGKRFKDKYLMEGHQGKIHGNLNPGRYKPELQTCPTCGFVVKCRRYLKAHIQTHLQNSLDPKNFKYSCPYENCNFKALTILYIRRHVRRIHKRTSMQQTYKCDYCNLVFKELKQLSVHVKEHQDVDNNQEDPTQFPNSSTKNQIKHNDDPLVISKCITHNKNTNQTSSREEFGNNSMDKCHDDAVSVVNEWKCPECGLLFMVRGHCRYHHHTCQYRLMMLMSRFKMPHYWIKTKDDEMEFDYDQRDPFRILIDSAISPL